MTNRPPRRVAVAALALVAAFALASCDTPEERAEGHYQRGMALLEEGEGRKARLEFRNALRLNGQHVGSRFQIGRMAERRENLRGAVSNYRLVAELDPAHLEARVKLAQFLLAGGEIDEAMRYAEQAVALAPADVDARTARAAAHFRRGDRQAALDDARTAVISDPDHPGANLLLLTDLAERDGPEAALAALDPLLERQPEERVLHVYRLRLLEAAGDGEGIVSQMRRMADQFPEETGLRRSLAQLLLRLERIDEAEAQMRRLADQTPEDPEPTLDLARLIAAVRGAEDARAELEARTAAAATEALAMTFRLAMVDLAMADGGVDAARAALQRAIAASADVATADRGRVRLAEIEVARGSKEEASRLVEDVLARDENNVGALTVRAALRIDALELDDAVLDLRRALNESPQNPRLLQLEAQAHELDGNAALAGERLAAAARLSEFSPEAAGRYAAFLRRQGQLSAAETALEESSRRNPSNVAILTALAQVRLERGDADGAEAVSARLRALENGGVVADRVSAAVLAQTGALAESADVLERVVMADEGEVALPALISTYVRSGETAQAQAVLDDILARDPDDVQAQALRAELEVLADDVPAAERRLTALVERAADNPSAYLPLVRLYAAQGRRALAEETAQAGIAVGDPGDEGVAGLRLAVAGMMERRGDFDAAIDQYAAVYEQRPGATIVANNLASLLAEHRADDPEAMAFAERVARRLRDSDIPHFLDTYGWIAFLRGDLSTALSSLVRAADALPDNALVQYHAGRALAEAGEAAEARRRLEASLRLDPQFPKAASAQAALAALDAAPSEASSGG